MAALLFDCRSFLLTSVLVLFVRRLLFVSADLGYYWLKQNRQLLKTFFRLRKKKSTFNTNPRAEFHEENSDLFISTDFSR
jgi:hypothetical protein